MLSLSIVLVILGALLMVPLIKSIREHGFGYVPEENCVFDAFQAVIGLVMVVNGFLGMLKYPLG